MKVKIIKESEVANVINNIKGGKFVNMWFCKKDGSLRKATCQFHVKNPTNQPHPKGTGESAKEALEAGRVKFFDAGKVNPDGTRGAYRQASISRIIEITDNGVSYIIDHVTR